MQPKLRRRLKVLKKKKTFEHVNLKPLPRKVAPDGRVGEVMGVIGAAKATCQRGFSKVELASSPNYLKGLLPFEGVYCSHALLGFSWTEYMAPFFTRHLVLDGMLIFLGSICAMKSCFRRLFSGLHFASWDEVFVGYYWEARPQKGNDALVGRPWLGLMRPS